MKGVGERWICLCVAALALLATALPLCGVSQAEVQKESFRGTCEQLNDFITRAGVNDARQQNHPQAAAWSIFAVTVNPYRLSYRAAGKDGEVCLDTRFEADAVIFSLAHQVTRLAWQPLGVVPKECLAERDRWQRRLEEREEQRLAKGEALIEQHNRGWAAASHSYRACGANEALARDAVRQRMEKDVALEVQKITAELQALADTPSGSAGIDQMDCSKCQQ